MKKFFARYPAALLALVVVLALACLFVAYLCFEMFELYRPAEILDEHLATFALPIGILFVYFFGRCFYIAIQVGSDLIKKKFHLQRNRH